MLLTDMRLAVVLTLAAALFGGCGGGAAKSPATPQCALNSDCAGKLNCVQGYCVSACQDNGSKDCPANEKCVKSDQGNWCQPFEKATCHLKSDCTSPLVCFVGDLQCRNECKTDVDCAPGQKCTSQTLVCADPLRDKNYDSNTNELIATNTDAGAGGDDAAGGGSDGGDAAGNRDGGLSDLGLPSCVPGLAGFHPSNLPSPLPTFASLATVSPTTNCTFNTETLTSMNCLASDDQMLNAGLITLPDRRKLAVIYVDTFTLPVGQTLSITGMWPLIIAANGLIEIDGTIVATSTAVDYWYAGGGPGTVAAARGGICPLDSASGGGGPGGVSWTLGFGSGGGGFCGMGGIGSALGDAGTGAPGGSPYGSPDLVPLVGGSGGGSTDGFTHVNHGGGAIELVSGIAVTIGTNGIINMGGGGDNTSYGQGGGSGGAILLEAPSIMVRGVLAANGGSGSGSHGPGKDGAASNIPALGGEGLGGDGSGGPNANGKNATLVTTAGVMVTYATGGGGGAGRIRLNSGCNGTVAIGTSGLLSPDATTPCYTKGSLQ